VIRAERVQGVGASLARRDARGIQDEIEVLTTALFVRSGTNQPGLVDLLSDVRIRLRQRIWLHADPVFGEHIGNSLPVRKQQDAPGVQEESLGGHEAILQASLASIIGRELDSRNRISLTLPAGSQVDYLLETTPQCRNVETHPCRVSSSRGRSTCSS
jgi:hypothetical protein